MLARVWWKEWRQFRPAWLGLLATAAVAHVLALAYGSGVDEQSGLLTPIALGWAGIYVVAAGAAAFAGERDGDTLRFLDGLPVDRRTLWLGKATFATASSLALAIALGVLSRFGVWGIAPEYAIGRVAPVALLVLFESTAWSLFWSALVGNALNAAILAIVTVGVSWGGPLTRLDEVAFSLDLQTVAARLAAGLLALAVSWVVVTRRPGRDRPRFRRAAMVPSTANTSSRSRSSRWAWAPAARSLAWQAIREGRATGLLLLAIGLGIPALGAVAYLKPMLVIVGVLVCLAAGVSVFSVENQAGTYRFLAERGVRPGLAWAVKASIGLGFVLAYGLLLLGVWWAIGGLGLSGRRLDAWRVGAIVSVGVGSLAFAVGLLAGMVIRRRITAGVIAAVGLFAVLVPPFILLSMGMIAPWGMLLPAPILLAISWAWSGAWMLDRPGSRRWVHLAGLLTGGLGLVAAIYIGSRALGVPDVALPFNPASVRSLAVPPDQNAAEPYRRALGLLEHQTLGTRAEILEEVRRGAALPRLQFAQLEAGDVSGRFDPAFLGTKTLASFVAADAHDRQSSGDLAGAWEDIRTLLAIAEQLAEAGSLGQAGTAIAIRRNALLIHHDAMVLGMEWAAAPGQSSAMLRTALADFSLTPRLFRLEDVIRTEYVLLERTLDLPADRLFPFLSPSRNVSQLGQGILARLFISSAWERTRALRAARWAAVGMLLRVDNEPWQLFRVAPIPEEEAYRENTPLLRVLNFNADLLQAAVNWEILWRRALEQVLALRTWQLDHDGAYPDRLAELVPAELPALPLDPYSGRPFGYIRSDGQRLLPLGKQGDRPGSFRPADQEPTRPGQPLLYSVGADLKDDRGQVNLSRGFPVQVGDVVFPLPIAEE